MSKYLQLLIALSMILAFSAYAGSDSDIHEGEWKITVEFDMPGMPMKMPPTAYNQCINKDEPIPKNEKPNQVCTTTNVKKNGNTYEWTMECTNPGGKMNGKGKITYEKDKMNGTMTMKGQGMENDQPV